MNQKAKATPKVAPKAKLKNAKAGTQKNVLKSNLNIGDIVRIEWLDVHGMDRQTTDDIQALNDPEPTRSFGVVVRLMDKSLAIAHELGDSSADGFSVSVYPYGLINAIDVLGHEDITL